MYTLDKINAIMKHNPVKNIAKFPVCIANFEKDLNMFRERTDTELPLQLKLPILIQMILAAWKK